MTDIRATDQKRRKANPVSNRYTKTVYQNSEAMMLMLVHEDIPYPSESQYLGFIRANDLAMFPKLLDQNQYNRRPRVLRGLVGAFRRYWLVVKGWQLESQFLWDTKPVPVMGYKRHKRHSDFAGSAGYGRCAARKLKYFGYKLVAVATLSGIPMVSDLVPANTDERAAAKTVLDDLSFCDFFGKRGFLGLAWQTKVFEQTNDLVWTPRRTNQPYQNDRRLDRWLTALVNALKAFFHEVQNTGSNIARLLAKPVEGLCTRIAAKMTSHLLCHLLLVDFSINVQTFEI